MSLTSRRQALPPKFRERVRGKTIIITLVEKTAKFVLTAKFAEAVVKNIHTSSPSFPSVFAIFRVFNYYFYYFTDSPIWESGALASKNESGPNNSLSLVLTFRFASL